ncbi:uncharacterized protein LOC119732479 isoform X2 [Patiria miniata]|uniref:UBZ2-type domain-containing protein n=1 Tax=Patiria miniata TaxID=46514 RepID=A0A914AEK9_PATMI|nr:uncharacterized protein LOC119732479 isoform X2 [Patiria miniata]
MASASATGTDRRGKLSLKRKRNAENCVEDDDFVADSNQTKRRPDGGGRKTDRFSKGQSADEKSKSSLKVKARLPRYDSDSATPSCPSVRLVRNQASLGSSQLTSSLGQSTLPDLPGWYGLKVKEEELQVTGTEVIKVGGVSVKWRPLPAYCRMCLVRSKQKRAAESRDRLRAFAGASPNIKRESCARNAELVPDQLIPGDIKSEPLQRSTDPRNGAMSEDSNREIDVKSEILKQKSARTVNSEAGNLSKPQLNHAIKIERKLHQNVPVKPQNGSSCHSKQSTNPLDDRKPQSLHRKALSLSATKRKGQKLRLSGELKVPSLKNENGLPRLAQTESGLHAKVGKLEPRQMAFSNTRTFPKDAQHSSPSTQAIGLGGLPKVVPISSEESVEVLAKIRSNLQHRISVKKVLSASRRDGTCGALARSDPSNRQSVNPDALSKSSLTPTHTNSVAALPTRFAQENLDSSEVIVLDSDDEVETTSSSPLTGFKRKLSRSSSDTDKRFCKKPKLIKVSGTGASGSLATRLISRPKSPVPKHCDGQVKPGFSKTAQTRLDGMLVRTSPGHTKVQPSTPSRNSQESSLGKPITAYLSSSEHPKQASSNNHVCKQGSLTQTKHLSAASSNSSAKKSAWNTSTNVKPLFKKQRSGQLNSVQVQNTEQVLTKVQADSFTGSSSYTNNESQKKLNFATAKGMDNSRKTLHKGAAGTLNESPQGKMTGFTLPATNTNPGQNPLSKQPRNQSVFRSNQVVGPLGKPEEKPSTSTGSAKNANIRLHPEFQTARNIRTDRDINLKRDKQPNTLGDNQTTQGLHGRSHPKQDTNHRNMPKGVNRDIYVSPHMDQHTNQSVFRSNQVVGPLGKPEEKPSTSTGSPKKANTRLYSGFQTARDIRTNWNITPKRDSQPNTLWDNQIAKGLYGRSYPYQGTSDSGAILSCPLCGLQFPKRLTPEERDEHIALCLSVSSEDVLW